MTIRVRSMAAEICEHFEDLLDKHDITIPDHLREGGEMEARLFGDTWEDLVQNVTDELKRLISKVKENPHAEFEYERY